MQELNIVIVNKFYETEKDLIPLIFDDEHYSLFENEDMYSALIALGVFSSRSEARKNWTKTGKEFEEGYNEYKGLGKLKKGLFIFNPVDTKEK
jgi:hypothetical protein